MHPLWDKVANVRQQMVRHGKLCACCQVMLTLGQATIKSPFASSVNRAKISTFTLFTHIVQPGLFVLFQDDVVGDEDVLEGHALRPSTKDTTNPHL